MLVVCDKGYLGGSMGNYVLEEEGGEVNGLVDNESKVVEYGIRYMRDPMDGEFIIFSKDIPSCML